ncbi:MAG TPA: helix-turn-helix domain-containing protein [Symbiobacteriaceae bacterium]|nr:helix-turn-helix domain-containing protein [Symbiobacteriaceae bacterium]
MTYRVTVQHSLVYEFLVSFKAYTDRASHKALDLGQAWVREVGRRLPEGFGEMASKAAKALPPSELTKVCPAGDDPLGLIEWLAGMPVGELYELIVPLVDDPAHIPPDLGSARDRFVQAGRVWHETYFSSLDPRIPAGLARNAEATAIFAREHLPAEAVEAITRGIVLDAGPHIADVILIPQYHFRPYNLFDWTPRQCVIGYAADVLPPAPGAAPPDLRNLIRALDDDSRLQILRFLAGGVRSFTDVVKFAGLAKSTVHHHMVTLRSSGLIRVHVRPEGADRYSLRPEAIDHISPRLYAFLKEEQPHAGL